MPSTLETRRVVHKAVCELHNTSRRRYRLPDLEEWGLPFQRGQVILQDPHFPCFGRDRAAWSAPRPTSSVGVTF